MKLLIFLSCLALGNSSPFSRRHLHGDEIGQEDIRTHKQSKTVLVGRGAHAEHFDSGKVFGDERNAFHEIHQSFGSKEIRPDAQEDLKTEDRLLRELHGTPVQDSIENEKHDQIIRRPFGSGYAYEIENVKDHHDLHNHHYVHKGHDEEQGHNSDEQDEPIAYIHHNHQDHHGLHNHHFVQIGRDGQQEHHDEEHRVHLDDNSEEQHDSSVHHIQQQEHGSNHHSSQHSSEVHQGHHNLEHHESQHHAQAQNSVQVSDEQIAKTHHSHRAYEDESHLREGHTNIDHGHRNHQREDIQPNFEHYFEHRSKQEHISHGHDSSEIHVSKHHSLDQQEHHVSQLHQDEEHNHSGEHHVSELRQGEEHHHSGHHQHHALEHHPVEALSHLKHQLFEQPRHEFGVHQEHHSSEHHPEAHHIEQQAHTSNINHLFRQLEEEISGDHHLFEHNYHGQEKQIHQEHHPSEQQRISYGHHDTERHHFGHHPDAKHFSIDQYKFQHNPFGHRFEEGEYGLEHHRPGQGHHFGHQHHHLEQQSSDHNSQVNHHFEDTLAQRDQYSKEHHLLESERDEHNPRRHHFRNVLEDNYGLKHGHFEHSLGGHVAHKDHSSEQNIFGTHRIGQHEHISRVPLEYALFERDEYHNLPSHQENMIYRNQPRLYQGRHFNFEDAYDPLHLGIGHGLEHRSSGHHSNVDHHPLEHKYDEVILDRWPLEY